MSRCRLEGGQESPGFRRGEVQGLTFLRFGLWQSPQFY